jgi:hypothetical protein
MCFTTRSHGRRYRNTLSSYMDASVEVIHVVQADVLALRWPLLFTVPIRVTHGVFRCRLFSGAIDWCHFRGLVLLRRNDVALSIDLLQEC